MESLALVAVIVLFTALIGGPTALLLTYVPDKPRGIKLLRRLVVLALSLVGLLFGAQLVVSSGVPFAPRIIGIIGVSTSIAALLYEFKILKRKNSKDTKKTYAVIFTSNRQDANSDLYYEHDDKLDENIKTMPGYIKHAGIRHPESREGVTIAYFDSLEAIDIWRKDSEHMDAKNLCALS